MESDDEQMLYGSDSLQSSSQELINDAASEFWAVTENTQELILTDNYQPTLPFQHTVTHRDAPMDSGAQWLERDFFTPTEELPPQELPFTNDAQLASRASHKERLISDIESVFESMIDALLNKTDSFSIFLKCRQTSTMSENAARRSIRFPGKNADEARRFTILICILEIIHEALITDRVISKREIFYRHPALFMNQAIVDRYVDDIAYTFCASRSLLNVRAAAKGLACGDLTISKGGRTVTQTLDDPAGNLIPNLDHGDVVDTTAQWILVVEKEAVFRSISTSSSWKALRHEGIMVTGKGYPDLSTRKFVHELSNSPRSSSVLLPVYALVDWDPDGMDIMCTYKYGSLPLAHEGDIARVAHLQWLGTKSTQALQFKSNALITSDTHQSERLLQLSHRDRKKALGMLSKKACFGDGLDDELRRELQIMLMLNLKAETEILESSADGMTGWLTQQLVSKTHLIAPELSASQSNHTSGVDYTIMDSVT